MKKISLILVLCLALASCGRKTENTTSLLPSSVPPTTGETPNHEHKSSWKPLDITPKPYSISAYDLSVNFDEVNKLDPQFSAIVNLKLNLLDKPSQTIELDAINLDIRQIILKNEWKSLHYKINPKTITVDLGSVYPTDRVIALEIQYRWNKPFNQGVHLTDRNDFLGGEAETIWSNSEPEEMPYWLPGDRQPTNRATWKLKVRAPKGYTVISNGELLSETLSGEHKITQWSQKEPMASYLFTMMIGKYARAETQWNGMPVHYYGVKEKIKNVAFALRNTPKALTYFSEKLGYEYPYSKYAQVVVSRYSWGGMEHTSATTLWDGPTRDTKYDIESPIDPLMSHELAHQWFGDLVTCKDWSHIWLNESFATFLEMEFEGYIQDRAKYDWLLALELNWFLAEDAAETKPIVFDQVHTSTDDMFDSRAYAKGGMVLRTLKYTLGEKAFYKGLGDYLREHAYTTVVTQDLQKSLEKSTGKDLTTFFKQWIYQESYPQFETSWSYSDSTKKVALKVKLTNANEKLKWSGKMPIEIDGKVMDIELSGDRDQTIEIAVAREPQYVRFNYDQTWVATNKMVQNPIQWNAQLEKSKDTWGRMEAAQSLAALSISATESQNRFSATMNCSKADKSLWVRNICAGLLKNLPEAKSRSLLAYYTELYQSSDFAIRTTAIEGIINTLGADSLSMVAQLLKKEDSFTVQGAAFKALAKFKDPRVLAFLQEKLANSESFLEKTRTAAMEALNSMEFADLDTALNAFKVCEKSSENNEYLQSATLDMFLNIYKTQPSNKDKAVAIFKYSLLNGSISLRMKMVSLLTEFDEPALIETLKKAEIMEVSEANRVGIHQELVDLGAGR